jgi:hypothetical protein
VVAVKIIDFWDVTPYTLVDRRCRFVGTYLTNQRASSPEVSNLQRS